MSKSVSCTKKEIEKKKQAKRLEKQKLKEERQADGGSITLTLNFIIPKVRGIMGLWQFSTKGSASSIPQVRDTFDAVIEQNGHCSGVVFDLSVKMHTSQKPTTASRYPVVTLMPNESEEVLRMIKECKKPLMIE